MGSGWDDWDEAGWDPLLEPEGGWTIAEVILALEGDLEPVVDTDWPADREARGDG